MKITLKVDKIIPIDIDKINNHVNCYLNENNYRVTKKTDHIIEFYDELDNLSFRSNLSYYKIIDEGVFKFQSDGANISSISLVYKLSITFEVIETIVILTFGFVLDKVALLLLIPALLNFLFKVQYIRLKVIDKNLFGTLILKAINE